MISITSASAFLTGLLFGVLGVYVFIKRRGSHGNVGYAIWCYFTVHWQITWAIIYSLNDPRLAEYLTRFGYTGIIFLPVSFYHFVITFLGKSTQKVNIFVAYAIGCVFAVSVWTGDVFVSGVYKYPWGYYPKVGSLHPFYLIFLSFLCITAVYALWDEVRKQTSYMRRTQVRYVLVGSITYILACVDFLGNYGVPLYPIGFVFNLISFGLIVYAIVKHRLLNINVIIRKTVIYSLVTSVLAAIMVLFAIVSAHFTQGYLGNRTFLSLALAACLITIIFHPLQLKIQSFVDKYFFRDWSERGEMVREVAAGFSHELKSPLAGLSMQAQMTLAQLEEVEKNPAALKKALPRIKEELHYMVNKAMDAARRIEAVRGVAEPSGELAAPVDVNAMLESSLVILTPLIKEVRVSVHRALPASLSPAKGSLKQLEIVFINLMKNALESMEGNRDQEKRALTLGAYEHENTVVITVKDTGSGIPYEDLDRIFEPHFTTKGRKGTGMGLFLAKQIIRAHGGHIEVKSEPENGTEFVVRLPKFSESAAA